MIQGKHFPLVSFNALKVCLEALSKNRQCSQMPQLPAGRQGFSQKKSV